MAQIIIVRMMTMMTGRRFFEFCVFCEFEKKNENNRVFINRVNFFLSFLWYLKLLSLLQKQFFVYFFVNLSQSDWIIQTCKRHQRDLNKMSRGQKRSRKSIIDWKYEKKYILLEKRRRVKMTLLFVWNWRLKKYFEMCFKFSNFSTKYLHE